jgi:hypothetical protein
MAFATSGFAQFLNAPMGRILRAVLGVLIILAGLLWVGGVVGWVVAAVGLVLVLAGLFDFCVLSPLFGGPFWGREIRAMSNTGAYSSK